MQITTHNLELTPETKLVIEEGYMSIHQFNLNILLLRCDVKFNPNFQDYEVQLKLFLDDQTFYVCHSDADLEATIDNTFLSLQVKLMKYQDFLGVKRFLKNKFVQLCELFKINAGQKVKS
ncbi:HPF/RaiA family ribosome-associated protein [Vibrio breoganii]|uniref:HPF/RaiA family ribosome-associated protein n=1 Tax=Vibrio breoganii TaxID=553239 RepID=UPI0012FFEDCE|nr:HPF/RaiA family ribosome-associated protein [Vibrio breoganii]